MLQLEKALAASENKKSTLNERNSQLLAEVAQYLLQITKCEQENSALQLARTSLEGCEGKAQQEVTALRIEISQLQSQLQEAQRELHIANTQVSVCTAAAAFAIHCTTQLILHSGRTANVDCCHNDSYCSMLHHTAKWMVCGAQVMHE